MLTATEAITNAQPCSNAVNPADMQSHNVLSFARLRPRTSNRTCMGQASEKGVACVRCFHAMMVHLAEMSLVDPEIYHIADTCMEMSLLCTYLLIESWGKILAL